VQVAPHGTTIGIRDKEIAMRSIAFALLLLGVTACPASASGTLIRARSFAWGCQFSASLNLLPQLESASQKDFDHIMQMLDSGRCMLIRAHQRLIVAQDQPTTYLAVRDMKRHGQWVGFVRKSDFSVLRRGERSVTASNRHHETTLHAAAGAAGSG
jgi:hypothetical protein